MYSTLIFLLAIVLVVNGGHSDGFLDTLIEQGPKPVVNGGHSDDLLDKLIELGPKPIVNGLGLVPTTCVNGTVECTTDEGRQGECVPTYMCKNKDGDGILTPRLAAGPSTYLETCCLPADKLQKPFDDDKTNDDKTNDDKTNDDKTNDDKTNPDGIPEGQTKNPGNGGSDKPGANPTPTENQKQCNGRNDVIIGGNKPGTDPTQPVPWRPGCGIRNENGVGIKINSKDGEAQFGEFPWMCAILREQSYKCGGSLIHPKVVLTAAHCLRDSQGKENDFKVRAGEWDTQTANEVLPYQERNVVKIIVHNKFRSNVLHNDIALMILDKEFNNVENVGVVCLPPIDSSPPLTKCLASGWGRDVFGKEGNVFVILKKIELPIVEHGKCQADLRKTRLGQYFELHESFTCAGGEAGKDTCTGDGGSPLVCPMPDNPKRHMQTGIVAWGIDCGSDSVPGVYVNVAHFREWISNKMVYNNIELDYYQDPTVEDC